MKCSELLFCIVSFGVVYLTTTAHCERTTKLPPRKPSDVSPELYDAYSDLDENDYSDYEIPKEYESIEMLPAVPTGKIIKIKPNHTHSIGRRHFNDTLVFNGTVMKKNPTRIQNVSAIFEWPFKKQKNNYFINKIVIEDKGNGGRLCVNDGGLKHKFVELYLESKPGKRYEYNITMYGY